MAIERILVGGFVDEEIAKINSNFEQCVTGDIPTKTSDLTNDSDFQTGSEVTAAINSAVGGINVPTNVSSFTNDAGYQTAAQVSSAVSSAVGAIDVPSKLSDLTNDANYVKSTDAAFLNKVDAVAGKGLSTNDYTAEDKSKVSKLGKIDFTTSSFTAGTDGYYSASLQASGRYPVCVMRKNGSDYEQVLAHTKVTSSSIVVYAAEAFEGYVVTI